MAAGEGSSLLLEARLEQVSDRFVLEGVPRIGYDVRLCPFPGAVESLMAFIGDPVDYDWLMGVSGACFRRAYERDDGGNVDLMLFSPEPERRVFQGLGFGYRSVPWSGREEMLAAIRASLAAGRPAIGFGIIGPPEAGLVCGFADGGETLIGYSYFQDRQRFPGTYEQPDWYEAHRRECPVDGPHGVIVLGEPVDRRPERETMVEALRWAVDLARAARRPTLPNHVCGLAANLAWADGLEVDEDYPTDDLKVRETRAMVYSDQATMLHERVHAAGFLRQAARALAEVAGIVESAAAIYEGIGAMPGLWPWRSYWFMDEEVQLGLCDHETRMGLAEGIRASYASEARAVELLEEALAEVG